MHYFVFYIVCNLAFIQCMRFAQIRGAAVPAVAAVNFVVAALVSIGLVFSTLAPSSVWHPLALSLGIVNGLLYASHLLATLAAFRFIGIGVTMALTHTACVFPVIVAHLVWPEEESMSMCRWIAIGLVPLAVYCLRPLELGREKLTWKIELLLLFLFFGVGVIFTVHKIAAAVVAPEMTRVYQMSVFSVAAIVMCTVVAIRRPCLQGLEIRFGVCAGLLNALMCRATVISLSLLGAVFFYLCGPAILIVGNVVFGKMLWRETMSIRQYVGVALAIAIVLLTGSDRLFQ